VDAVYVPELTIDFSAEVERLRRRMDEKDGVNIFLSEGAGVEMIVAEMEAAGEDVPRDPFGHVRLDDIQPGQWFAKQFTEKLGAEKTLVQKSGYFARSAAPNDQDLELIRKTAKLVSQFGIEGNSGVVGMDQDDGDKLGLISFDRIKGGKPFDTTVQWFVDMLNEIGQ
jgi:pyrophosphate--fructose-6-phosphate 1-phosphotransferase